MTSFPAALWGRHFLRTRHAGYHSALREFHFECNINSRILVIDQQQRRWDLATDRFYWTGREDAENATRLDGEWNGKGNTLRVDHRMGLLKHNMMKSSKYDNASITT